MQKNVATFTSEEPQPASLTAHGETETSCGTAVTDGTTASKQCHCQPTAQMKKRRPVLTIQKGSIDDQVGGLLRAYYGNGDEDKLLDGVFNIGVYDRLALYSYRLGANSNHEDISQEVLLRFLRSARERNLKLDTRLYSGWMCRTAKNLIIDDWRSPTNREIGLSEAVLNSSHVEANAFPDPHREMEGKALRKLAGEVFTTLPMAWRPSVNLCIFEKKTPKQAADQLGKSRRTVAYYVKQATERFEKRISEHLTRQRRVK